MRARRVATTVVLAIAAAACAAPSDTPAAGRLSAPCFTTYRAPGLDRTAVARLTRDLDRYIDRQPGRVVFSAYDLVTGTRFGHRAHENGIITASGAKVDLVTALLTRRGRLGGYERDLIERMIRESDNHAADALWWRVGGGSGMSRFYRRVGMSETVPGPSRYWGGTTTSPADRLRLLTFLMRGGSGLTGVEGRLILSLMGQVVPDQAWGVSAAARPGDRIVLKNGWTPRPFVHHTWAVTSYGRITGPGRDLLLAVQTDLQPGEERGIKTIEGLAKILGARLDGLRPERRRSCSASL